MSVDDDVAEGDTYLEEKNSTFFPRDSTSKKFLLQPKKYKCSLKQHNKREDTITTYYFCLCVTYIKGTSVLLTSMNAHFFIAWFSALFFFMYKCSKLSSANFAALLRQIKWFSINWIVTVKISIPINRLCLVMYTKFKINSKNLNAIYEGVISYI